MVFIFFLAERSIFLIKTCATFLHPCTIFHAEKKFDKKKRKQSFEECWGKWGSLCVYCCWRRIMLYTRKVRETNCLWLYYLCICWNVCNNILRVFYTSFAPVASSRWDMVYIDCFCPAESCTFWYCHWLFRFMLI